MCGEDLESYRSGQVKLVILAVGIFAVVTIFLTPAMFINWLFGRFDHYIYDTFFDWPSYLISLACWGGAWGALVYLGRNQPES